GSGTGACGPRRRGNGRGRHDRIGRARRHLRVRHRTRRLGGVAECRPARHVCRPEVVEEMTDGALAGIRVLELGTRIGAPFAATLLAEFGAEVIKVEQPGVGDFMRTIPRLEDGDSLSWALDGLGMHSYTL